MKIVVSETTSFVIDLDAPVLPAEPMLIDGVEQWRAWCRHCDKWHMHGSVTGRNSAGSSRLLLVPK
jgi:hypothetical protein